MEEDDGGGWNFVDNTYNVDTFWLKMEIFLVTTWSFSIIYFETLSIEPVS